MKQSKIKEILIENTSEMFSNSWYDNISALILNEINQNPKKNITSDDLYDKFKTFFLNNDIPYLKASVKDINRIIFKHKGVSNSEIRIFLKTKCNLESEKLQKYIPYNELCSTTGLPFIINRSLFI